MSAGPEQLPLKKTLLVITITLCFAILFFLYIQSTFHVLRIHGESMSPNLGNGDILLAVSRRKLHRFDLIVFKDPLSPKRNLIKRLVAFAGETVSFRSGQLFIDNQALSWPGAADGRVLQHDMSLTTPAGQCYVLGDNPYSSQDSRQIGPVPMQLIWAQVLLRLWPPKFLGINP